MPLPSNFSMACIFHPRCRKNLLLHFTITVQKIVAYFSHGAHRNSVKIKPSLHLSSTVQDKPIVASFIHCARTNLLLHFSSTVQRQTNCCICHPPYRTNILLHRSFLVRILIVKKKACIIHSQCRNYPILHLS